MYFTNRSFEEKCAEVCYELSFESVYSPISRCTQVLVTIVEFMQTPSVTRIFAQSSKHFSQYESCT